MIQKLPYLVGSKDIYKKGVGFVFGSCFFTITGCFYHNRVINSTAFFFLMSKPIESIYLTT